MAFNRSLIYIARNRISEHSFCEDSMRFAEVQFLWLLFSLFFLALFFFYSYRRKKLLASRFVSLSMLPKVATSFSPWRRLIKSTLLLFALAFLIVALARPQWGQTSNHIERKGLDLMLLQDVSSSMLAEDVKPNRLTRSKHEISAFLESLSGDRIALVAFSGEAELVLPLTLDYGAAQLALRDLEPGWLMPGTDLEAAIKKGIEVFKDSKTDAKYAVMVLMSDGEELQNEAVTAAKEASKLGIKIYTIGRSEEHTSELQSRPHLVCRLLLEKKKQLYTSFSDCNKTLFIPHAAKRRSVTQFVWVWKSRRS